MADVSGITGSASLKVGATTNLLNINITDWSGAITMDTVPIPPNMTDDPPVEKAGRGAIRITGSANGKLDDSDFPVTNLSSSQMTGEVVLTMDTSKTLTFNALYSNIAMNRRLSDTDVTIDFRNSGTIATNAFA